MANNRLYLKDTETGEEILLCKSMGNGWLVRHTIEELNKWLDLRDVQASFGDAGGNTNLIVYAQNDEAKD